ncbi:undecaprenyl-phosphate alpha-N-acetylglucosaminyl 1-phosphate transferase [Thiocapsa sp. UBA6158]|jgi:UDP-GlcNAc:undecaprenyl-phosphate GlcNAc-1-phosphate transferase|uniref:undecaprenyl-phosphate alpha-N-acetylglucosaminyl 1-phosphate transferase n=1 Tax=Thiocapsa sp. UBA6158 TaxID=1947692 RepID=UPI0025DBDE34|nr:undecaprenyl-phosphate alpha-N-acetylglucosaminyl 1-phosphate transferase [Thiocapsa sp. UBA6158]
MLVLVSLLSTLLMVWILLRVLHSLADRIGLVDRPDQRRKRHAVPVPVVGGIAIYGGILAGALWWFPLSSHALSLLLGAGVLVAVGVMDDRFHLGVGIRFAGQSTSALLLIFGADVRLDSLGDIFGTGPVELGIMAVPVTMIAIVGMINAFNMIDGMDGLAGGLALIALGGVLAMPGVAETSRLSIALICIALLPFLVHNLRLLGVTRHRVFLGDAGSMLMGYLVVWTMIEVTQGPGSAIAPVAALWLTAIPLLDTFGVMARRMRRGRSPFAADRRHLHHDLLRAFGCSKKTLRVILSGAVLMAAIGVSATARSIPEATLFYAFFLIVCLYFASHRIVPRVLRWSYRKRRNTRNLGHVALSESEAA